MLLKKGEFAELCGKSKGRISQLIREGLPVEPSGLVDADKANAWLEARSRNVELRIPASTKIDESKPEGSLSQQLLAAKVQREQATASLTIVKVEERQGELGKVAEFRAESRRAAERVRDSMMEFGRSAAVAIAGKFGLDLGEVQVFMAGLTRDHARKQSAEAKAEYERMEAGA